MNEFLVALPFLVATFYCGAKGTLGGGWYFIFWMLNSWVCLFGLILATAHEYHRPDPKALQNAHAAIIGKLRAELDECREEK